MIKQILSILTFPDGLQKVVLNSISQDTYKLGGKSIDTAFLVTLKNPTADKY
jgi:hypothetical protein